MPPDTTTAVPVPDRRSMLAAWFADFHAPLFRYLVRLVADEEQAADLLQETFVRALGARTMLAADHDLSAWLYRIAANLAYDTLRRRNRWRWVPFRGTEHTPAFEGQVATAQSVHRCLARLRPHEAEALLLCEYAGFSAREIAAATHVEVSTVYVRLHRARIHFRALYTKEVWE